jgi:hypothetical protein
VPPQWFCLPLRSIFLCWLSHQDDWTTCKRIKEVRNRKRSKDNKS